MKDPEDIITYNRLTQQNRLYQFFAGINETFDKDRHDILLQNPLPTVEEAYASILREIMRRGVMRKEPSSEFQSSGTGGSLTSKGDRKNLTGMMIARSHLRCNHCGGTRHTKNECFKLVGYLDWWPDAKKRGAKVNGRLSDQPRTGQSAMGMSVEERIDEHKEGAAMNNTAGNRGALTQSLYRDLGWGGYMEPYDAHTHISFNPSNNCALSVFNNGWIFYCGATDTMLYNPKDFLSHVRPGKNLIKTASGEGIKVK